ncbi:MAG: peptide-methionine (S)-S-oxide reductase [Litorimonas sp.]
MTESKTNMQTIAFGGGCHWCTEAVFQSLRGVSHVEQGFARSDPPHDSWSEAARVSFDAAVIPLSVLTDIHLRTHASTAAHSMRGKYRSAVYVTDDGTEARAVLDSLQAGFDAPLVTQVLPLRDFRLSDARFRNYYATDPERPFCRTYIDPKLAMLRREFSDYSRPGSSAAFRSSTS